jgi:type I site-specific restriction-modification system R (restriction) subunit
MPSPGFFQRLRDLEIHISKDLELLNEFEEALRYETNPRVKAGYRQEIQRQYDSLARYKQEYAELEQGLSNVPNAQMRKVENQLQHMDAKLNVLLNGQVVIYENQNQMRQALLNRYDAIERAIISAITQQLDQTQLILIQNLIDALEKNLISEQEIQQMLVALEKRIPALPVSNLAVTEIIKNPELDAKHKLKITLPIVPMLVEYEGELEFGTGLNIKSAWEQLIAKLRRN